MTSAYTLWMADRRYRVFGRPGEYDRDGLHALIRSGSVTPETSIAIDGTSEWKPAHRYEELSHDFELAVSRGDGGAARGSFSRIWNRAAAIFMMIIALFLGVPASYNVYGGHRSTAWSSTAGKLVVQKSEQDMFIAGANRHAHVKRMWYEYTVGARQFSNGRVSFGGRSTLDKYEKHPDLTVYYNPAAPDDATLETGVDDGVQVQGLFAVFAAVMSVMSFFFGEALSRRLNSPVSLHIGKERSS